MMTLTQCVVLLVSCALGSYSFIVDNKDTLGDNATVNIISMFTEHNILFHYDNTSRDRVDSIINKIVYRNSNIILMANYDVYQDDDTANENINFIRPLGYKFLHVVMLSNFSTFQKYTASSIYSFEYLDIVLVIIGKRVHNLTDFDIFIENVNRAGTFFLFDILNLTLYNNCYYCGERAKIWAPIANLLHATAEDFLSVKLLLTDIYENEFSNFSEHVFSVGYTNYKPFFWCQIEQVMNETEITVGGSEGELLYVIQEKLNIYFQMIEITDNKTSWYTIIETVRNGTFDWIVGGVTPSRSRLELLQFTQPINNENFVVLYARFNNPWMSWISLLIPFKLHVWIALFVTALTVATILFIIARTIKPKLRKKIKYLNFIQGILRYLVEQPIPIVRQYMKARWTVILIMTLWLLVAQIITNSYKSKITSSIINYKGLMYKNVDELLKSKFRFYIHVDDEHIVRESLKLSNDTTYLEVLKKSEIYHCFCSQILEIIASKKAIIGHETVMQYLVRKICLPLFNTVHIGGLRLLKEKLLPCAQAWPMAKNTPYLVAFNSVISRLNAAGIINKWNNDYAPTAKTVLKSNEKRTKRHSSKTKFTMKSMIGPLLLWFVGIIAATLSFLNELRLRKHIC